MSSVPSCKDGVCQIRTHRGIKGFLRAKRRPLSILAFAILALIMLDISIARLRYHYMLLSTVSLMKAEIENDLYNFHGDVSESLKGCQAFDRVSGSFIHNCSLSACEQNAVLLSQRRQEVLGAVRAVHPTSRIVAELFDGMRGVDQSEKVEKLFSRKTCEGVISSSDKTNIWMDILAACLLLLGVYMSWCAFVGVWKVFEFSLLNNEILFVAVIMSSIKELTSKFERPVKTEEQKKEDKKQNAVHKLVRTYMDKTSPKPSPTSHKENADKDGKTNLSPPPIQSFSITDGFRPASPPPKPQFRIP